MRRKQPAAPATKPLTPAQIATLNRIKKLRVECAELAREVTDHTKGQLMDVNAHYASSLDRVFTEMAMTCGRTFVAVD